MQYEIEVRPKNIPAYVDIEHDIQRQQNGLFTFTVRVNNGNVVDYVVTEYVPSSNYIALKSITLQEFTFVYNSYPGDKQDTLRGNNS